MFKQQYKNLYNTTGAFVTNAKVASGKQVVSSVQSIKAVAMTTPKNSTMKMSGSALKMMAPSQISLAQRVSQPSSTSLKMLAGPSTFKSSATPRQNRFLNSELLPMISRPVIGQAMTQGARFSTATKAQNKSASPTRFEVKGETETPVKEGFMDSVVGDLQKGSKLRSPKEYMFATTDFSKDKEEINKILDSGVLFRYHQADPSKIPVARAEADFCEKFGFKYALACNSASSGLLLSLLACGLQEGDHVLMPAFTFVAVPSTIVLSGAKPILVEIDETYAINPDHLIEQIEKYKPKFFMLSYMRGAVPDMDKIVEICEKYNITLIEDCAHALGVKWKGKQMGKFGQSMVTSFQSHKMVDAGEGGMLATDNIDVFLKAAFLSGCYEANIRKHIIDHPEKEEKIKECLNKIPPYNLRMSNLSAAVLFRQFSIVEEKAERHRQLYKMIYDGLDKERISFPATNENTTPCLDSMQFGMYNYSIEERIAYQKDMNSQGIPINVIGLAQDNARVFFNWKFIDPEMRKPEDFPVTNHLIEGMVDVRIPYSLTEEEAMDLCTRMNDGLDKIDAARAAK